MSCDIERLQSASDLRVWEEARAKSFGAWRSSAESLITGIRHTIGLGAAQHQHINEFLRARSVADRAYAQALSASPAPTSPSAAPKLECQTDPFIQAMSDLQAKVAATRENFATTLLDGAVSQGLSATNDEFEKKTGALLKSLDSGLADSVQVHNRAAEAMAEYHRSSIEVRKEDPPCDAWLVEHRYRRAVEIVRERQRCFTAQLCTAVEEVWRLEEWREEMARKVMHRFCTKVFEVETTVQSLANDGIRALAGQKKEDAPSTAMLRELEKLLRAPPPPPAGGGASSSAPPKAQSNQKASVAEAFLPRPKQGEWPVLLRLREQGHVGSLPPSVLAVVGGALKSPRRWYGSQLAMVILTKDFWLHSFAIAVDPVKAASGSLEAMESEPSWSLYMPCATITLPSGKARSIELEEKRKGFLGISNTIRETLQADDDNTFQHWLTALQFATEKTTFKSIGGGRSSDHQVPVTAVPPPSLPQRTTPPPPPTSPQRTTPTTNGSPVREGEPSQGNGDSLQVPEARSAVEETTAQQHAAKEAVFNSSDYV